MYTLTALRPYFKNPGDSEKFIFFSRDTKKSQILHMVESSSPKILKPDRIYYNIQYTIYNIQYTNLQYISARTNVTHTIIVAHTT